MSGGRRDRAAPRRAVRADRRRDSSARARPDRQLLLSGLLLGVGTAAFVDEVVFHQLLRWHHFVDASTTAVGLVSDGVFHAVGWFAAVGGVFVLADLRRRAPGPVRWARWWGGVLVGLGAFQLWDGTVQHKLLRLHQIRYEVDLLPYDATWIAVAVALLAAGVVLLRRTRTSRVGLGAPESPGSDGPPAAPGGTVLSAPGDHGA